MTIETDIYRCSKREGLYLYVAKGLALETLPSALLKTLGKTELAMTLAISEEKPLARVDAADVIRGIKEQDYFLQMPPSLNEEL